MPSKYRDCLNSHNKIESNNIYSNIVKKYLKPNDKILNLDGEKRQTANTLIKNGILSKDIHTIEIAENTIEDMKSIFPYKDSPIFSGYIGDFIFKNPNTYKSVYFDFMGTIWGDDSKNLNPMRDIKNYLDYAPNGKIVIGITFSVHARYLKKHKKREKNKFYKFIDKKMPSLSNISLSEKQSIQIDHKIGQLIDECGYEIIEFIQKGVYINKCRDDKCEKCSPHSKEMYTSFYVLERKDYEHKNKKAKIMKKRVIED